MTRRRRRPRGLRGMDGGYYVKVACPGERPEKRVLPWKKAQAVAAEAQKRGCRIELGYEER